VFFGTFLQRSSQPYCLECFSGQRATKGNLSCDSLLFLWSSTSAVGCVVARSRLFCFIVETIVFPFVFGCVSGERLEWDDFPACVYWQKLWRFWCCLVFCFRFNLVSFPKYPLLWCRHGAESSRMMKKATQGESKEIETAQRELDKFKEETKWNPSSPTPYSCVKSLTGHTDYVRSLVVLPSGLLASSSADRTIRIWNTESGLRVHTLTGHTASVWSLVVLPSGQLASGSIDKTIRIWNTESGLCVHTLTGHTDHVWSLVVLPSGLLASASHDKTIRIWNTPDRREVLWPQIRLLYIGNTDSNCWDTLGCLPIELIWVSCVVDMVVFDLRHV